MSEQKATTSATTKLEDTSGEIRFARRQGTVSDAVAWEGPTGCEPQLLRAAATWLEQNGRTPWRIDLSDGAVIDSATVTLHVTLAPDQHEAMEARFKRLMHCVIDKPSDIPDGWTWHMNASDPPRCCFQLARTLDRGGYETFNCDQAVLAVFTNGKGACMYHVGFLIKHADLRAGG